MGESKFSRFTRGLRWVVLVAVLALTLAGCPSTGSSQGPNQGSTQGSSSSGGGAVPNESNALNNKSGCGTGCTQTGNASP
jgi:hypothetical protein